MAGLWLIALTVITAVLLSVVPLPVWAQWGRPEWLALVLLYWVIALPHRVGLATAFGCGLLLDLVEGTPLGQNALALVLVAFVGQILYRRLRMFAAWQQAGTVFVLIGLHQLISHWVQAALGRGAPDLLFLVPALTSALIWPGVLVLLRGLRRRYGVT